MLGVESSVAARAAWDAELLLLKLEAEEELALSCETEASEYLRGEFARSYRKAIGVFPERRNELREALVRVQHGGGMPVKDVIAALNRQ